MFSFFTISTDQPPLIGPVSGSWGRREHEERRRLVGDLSLLTTADSKELQIQLEPVEPDAMLKQVRHAFEAIAGRENKDIQYSIMPKTPMIYADHGRMVQVMSNLVDNALRYTPPGGTILLTAGLIRGKVENLVTDNGSGIHPDDLPYVFDRFYKADKARDGNSGKMGLGLAIAKALVTAQGGSIHVESASGGTGTTFVLGLNLCGNASPSGPGVRFFPLATY